MTLNADELAAVELRRAVAAIRRKLEDADKYGRDEQSRAGRWQNVAVMRTVAQIEALAAWHAKHARTANEARRPR